MRTFLARALAVIFVASFEMSVPASLAAQAAAQDSVWVNTSSRVYHCPGTRYYGTTSRGRFMSEGAATAEGNRPAYGRGCGGLSATPAPQRNPSQASPAQPAGFRVWLNTASRVYHCPGTRYFGNTKAGRYMTEADAVAAGYRPAGGRRCG